MPENSAARSASRYGLMLLLSGCTLVAAVAGVNALVDPFDIYRLVRIEGFNAYKPAIYNRVRLHKAFELRRVRPQTIILGTSRNHVGLRCAHEALARLDEACYNLAYDGATTQEMFAYLRHAHAIQPLHHVVLGLDSYLLSAAPSFTRPGFDPLILRDAATPAWWRAITGDLRLLASLDTLRASIATVLSQKWPEPSWFAPDGQRLGEVFFHRDGESFMRDGPRAYFDEVDRLEARFQTQAATPGDARRSPAAVQPDASGSSFAYIGHIVDFCRAQGIDLRIFISPSHMHQLEIAAAAGALLMIEDGKRALTHLLAEDALLHPFQPPVPLIDFSGYSSITAEALPPVGSHDEMRYYWDSSHFKELVGDYVLDRLFGATTAAREVPDDFGMPLSEDTVASILAAQRLAQLAYRKRFPEEVAALRAMVRSKRDTGAPLISASLAIR